MLIGLAFHLLMPITCAEFSNGASSVWFPVGNIKTALAFTLRPLIVVPPKLQNLTKITTHFHLLTPPK